MSDGQETQSGHETTQSGLDKLVMKNAAWKYAKEEYESHTAENECAVQATVYDFKAGWQSCLNGPAVTELIKTLETIASNGEGRGMGWTPAQNAREALAEFEKAKGGK